MTEADIQSVMERVEHLYKQRLKLVKAYQTTTSDQGYHVFEKAVIDADAALRKHLKEL